MFPIFYFVYIGTAVTIAYIRVRESGSECSKHRMYAHVCVIVVYCGTVVSLDDCNRNYGIGKYTKHIIMAIILCVWYIYHTLR